MNAIMLFQLYPPGAAVSKPWTGAIKDSGAPPPEDAHDQSQVRACVCAQACAPCASLCAARTCMRMGCMRKWPKRALVQAGAILDPSCPLPTHR